VETSGLEQLYSPLISEQVGQTGILDSLSPNVCRSNGWVFGAALALSQ